MSDSDIIIAIGDYLAHSIDICSPSNCLEDEVNIEMFAYLLKKLPIEILDIPTNTEKGQCIIRIIMFISPLLPFMSLSRKLIEFVELEIIYRFGEKNAVEEKTLFDRP